MNKCCWKGFWSAKVFTWFSNAFFFLGSRVISRDFERSSLGWIPKILLGFFSEWFPCEICTVDSQDFKGTA